MPLLVLHDSYVKLSLRFCPYFPSINAFSTASISSSRLSSIEGMPGFQPWENPRFETVLELFAVYLEENKCNMCNIVEGTLDLP
jgi:hypothetical protein